MELEFNEEQYECKLIETKKNVTFFKIDDESENKKKAIVLRSIEVTLLIVICQNTFSILINHLLIPNFS